MTATWTIIITPKEMVQLEKKTQALPVLWATLLHTYGFTVTEVGQSLPDYSQYTEQNQVSPQENSTQKWKLWIQQRRTRLVKIRKVYILE